MVPGTKILFYKNVVASNIFGQESFGVDFTFG